MLVRFRRARRGRARSLCGAAAGVALAASAALPAHASDWPSYNRTLTGDGSAALKQINAANASELEVLCTYETGQ